MEYNIERSSSVSMFKKQRKLDDGNVVWDSVVKLRKKNRTECSKYPKNRLGIRNNWIKEFSNVLSDKASEYVLETMSSERTTRQEEIAQTLLSRFNNILEQEATMSEPKTLTHKAMVMMADKLSLWLDKNVKVSKSVTNRLRKMEEEEKKKRLIEEMQRLEQERRDREEERKRQQQMAEEQAKQMAETKSATDVMRPRTEPESEVESPEMDEDQTATEPGDKAGDDQVDNDRPWDKDDKPPDDGQQGGGTQSETQEPRSESTDEAQKPEGMSEDTKEGAGAQLEGKQDGAGTQEGSANEADGTEGKLDDSDKQGIENEVSSDIAKMNSKDDMMKAESEDSPERDIPDDSPLRTVLGVGGIQSAEGTEDGISSNYPAPDLKETPSETLNEVLSPSQQSEPMMTSGSEFSDTGDLYIEPSKESVTLDVELLSSEVEDVDVSDSHDKHGHFDDKTNKVLHELAEIIATTREEHSPLQEALKDIMGKELEERLGDKDVQIINEVAGKVGTWMDKMVEQAGEEYGERRSPSRARTASPRASSPPKSSLQVPYTPVSLPRDTYTPGAVPQAGYPSVAAPQAGYPPATLPQGPLPTAVSPEGLADTSLEKARDMFLPPPVSQKPKGPIFELRKVDTKNIFNVAGISNTKAKRKIREARGLPRGSQDSLDIEEWAEWAGLVSDVGRNWAKWIEGVAHGVERPSIDRRLSGDAREWKNITRELVREGDEWMKKVIRKQNKTVAQKSGETPKADTVSA